MILLNIGGNTTGRTTGTQGNKLKERL